MPIFVGLDLGTTTITGLALTDSGEPVVAVQSLAQAERRSDASASPQRFEWDADAMAARAEECVRLLVDELGSRRAEVAAIGVTGQQHGVVVVDEQHRPLTPFINWQDRRGEEMAAAGRTYLDEALGRLGPEAPRRAGCTLATGYLGLTLFWMQQTGVLPASGTACSIMDYVTARLTGSRPVSEPTCAAASGLFNVTRREWDRESIAALALTDALFPEIREAGSQAGKLDARVAARVGLAAGMPVATPIGDQQAGFVGSVTDRVRCGHLNVGTGAQLGAFVGGATFQPPLELRPFPMAGNLLTGAVLCGGWSFQVLEQFFRHVGRDVLATNIETPTYSRLTELAAAIPAGSDGLMCEPLFAGTRADSSRRAVWSGMTAANFTPAHMTRALFEGMARHYHEQLTAIEVQSGRKLTQLVGTGNALRENRLLREIVARECGIPLVIPRHREEAAFGAALLAAVSVGRYAGPDDAGELIRYE